MTIDDAVQWWYWYEGASNNAHRWEVAAHRAGGWNGAAMLVMPGQGSSLAILTNRLDNLLGPSTISPGDFWANICCDWHSVIAAVGNASSTVIDISCVLDGSGIPANNASAPGDQSVTLSNADPHVSHWSSVRWIAYLAGINGGIECLGESVGGNDAPGNVAPCMAQAQQCGLYALMWANDISMAQGGTSHATPAQVVAGFNAAYGL